MRKILLTMLGVLMALPGIAYDFIYGYEGQSITYTVINEDAKTCMTAGGNWAKPGNRVSGTLVLPANPKDGGVEYTLVSIGTYGFLNCDLTSVIIPNSVKYINDYAFDGCAAMTSVVIGNSVKSVGTDAFDCVRLKKTAYPNTLSNPFGNTDSFNISYPAEGAVIEDGFVYGPNKSAIYFAPLSLEGEYTIPESVTSIGNNAFKYCDGLNSVVIGNSVASIGDEAFSECSGLTSVIIGNSVTSIGTRAFYECSGLASVNIPNSVTSIGTAAFSKCSGLTSVNIPNSVTSIGGGAFYGCSGLTSVNIPNSVTSIGEGAFSKCSGLTSVNIPESVTSIGDEAFSECSGLTSVLIPNSVTSIGGYAFYKCSGLTSVIIPPSVTSIGSAGPFVGCSGLQKSAYPNTLRNLFVPGVTIPYPAEGAVIEDGFVYGPNKSAIYFAPLSLEGEYLMPESVTSIGKYAFRDCRKMTSVLIPNSVTSIGYEAFYNCTGLQKWAYPNTLSNPFGNYGYGVAICYPAEGAEIEDGIVYGPNKSAIYFAPLSLEGEFTIPNSVTSIRQYTFSGCDGLTSIIIPPLVTDIGYKAFSDCNGLKKTAYPNTLSNPFGNTDSFNMSYPAEGAVIEDGFVYGPNKSAIYFAPLSLEGEYSVPESVMSVGSAAFKYCDGLNSVVIGNSVTSIGDYAFRYCSGLTSVVIGNSVTSIGYNAFYNCSGVTEVVALSDMPAMMDDSSFEGLYDQTRLVVPEGSAPNYLATNWSLFKNLTAGSEAIESYSDGVLTYRIIPATIEGEKNTAVVIAGNYESLTEVSIPERFSDPESQTRYYVEGIGYEAFKNCSNLKTISFNNRSKLTSIGDYAFQNTDITTIELPATVTTLGKGAFQNNYSLREVVWNDALTYVPDDCFRGCSNLEWPINSASDLKIESIGQSAFHGCKKIGTVFIPATVNSIGENAFLNSTVSKVITPSVADWCKIEFGNSSSNPASLSRDLWIADADEAITNLEIPEEIERVNNYAFSGCKSIKTLSLPNTLLSIGDGAFKGLNGIVTLVVPNSVAEIGTDAFDQCAALRDITLGRSLQTLDANSFTGCNFDRMTIADSTDKLTLEGSWNDIKVSDLYMGRTIESTNGFKTIENLTVGNLAGEITNALFKGCKNLKTVSLGSGLTSIGDEAFSGLALMEEVIVPPSVETIGASAFAGNTALKSIIMGHSVKTIGEKAFDGCPASTVSITAQTPPAAPNNTFSNYTGNLYLQGKDAVNAYYDAFACWDRFDGLVMIEPTEMQLDGDKKFTGKPGDTFQLSAKLMPEGVSLPQIFWRSTNPDIATVDANGLVTLHAYMNEAVAMAEDDDTSATSCKIIAESLYADGPVAEVEVTNISTGIGEVISDNLNGGKIDFNAPVEVYNLSGMLVGDSIKNLASGIYVVRQGANVCKIAVK